MNKELKIIISMCLQKKQSYTAIELAAFLNLKYVEGVYPYLRKLQEHNLIIKQSKGEYSLNDDNPKIQDMKFIVGIAGGSSFVLFTNHTKRVLQKFSSKPLLHKNELPKNNLRIIKDIANKTKIIHQIKENNLVHYFIACWEEPTQRLLDFFDITLQFDIEDFKHRVVQHYSSIPSTQTPVDDTEAKELKRVNMESYITGKDSILDKLKDTTFPFAVLIKELTENKNKQFSDNPFKITSKIADWKLNYVYNTDKIEGNPLTMQDVKTILTIGALSVDKDKKAVLETLNSRTALDNIFNTDNELTEDFIKRLHLATQQGIDPEAGNYKKRENCVVDNSGHFVDSTTPVEFVEKRMKELIEWYDNNKKSLHPFVLASVIHNQFVYIHPFSDGNGRVARLLFNFLLIKYGFFPIIFYNDEREKYYSNLRRSKTGEIKEFTYYGFTLYRIQLDTF